MAGRVQTLPEIARKERKPGPPGPMGPPGSSGTPPPPPPAPINIAYGLNPNSAVGSAAPNQFCIAGDSTGVEIWVYSGSTWVSFGKANNN